MPTALPRVSVAITKEQHSILTRLAKLQNRPVSSFIRDVLDSAMPVLRASVPILEARERTLEEQPRAVAEAAQGLLAAFQGMDPDQLSLLDITDADLQDLATATNSPGGKREPEEGSGTRGPQRKRGPHAPPPLRTTRSARARR